METTKQKRPWATCEGCRYFGYYGGPRGSCYVDPKVDDDRHPDSIACRHYVERYTPPPADAPTFDDLANGGSKLKIQRIPRGDRGFLGYGEPVRCTYGTVIEVYESSAVAGPLGSYVWLRLNSKPWRDTDSPDASAHLNAEQVREVIARLQAWLDDQPTPPPKDEEADRG